MDMQRENSIVD